MLNRTNTEELNPSVHLRYIYSIIYFDLSFFQVCVPCFPCFQDFVQDAQHQKYIETIKNTHANTGNAIKNMQTKQRQIVKHTST